MDSLELIMTAEPNFIPVVNQNKSAEWNNRQHWKLNPDYTEIVSKNPNDTIDITEIIITSNNRSLITESKSGETCNLRQEMKQQKKTTSSHTHLLLPISW